ncbi:peptidoglycan-binding protein [Mesorhizobium sp. YIM 152430]|uniref:peptidoglycan-binding protein n=1 Tax=Mesorhizobium sp. YIM 152430 TaxID=3031761 RepID=UPI0023DCA7C1|nr:peptidoglycan-binding protein [Mesorhizobium sp. YIM 152430]MDF1599102.1 peptidoglycan-binding protein [Mesorhizobium sp. YIM 152430]
MTQKQAYLDALNSGRRRRPTTSIEDLNRTLAELETRIAGRSKPAGTEAAQAPTRLAADMEIQRQHEDSIEAAGSIAAELKLLREDLNAKLAAGIEREFAALKTQIEGARAAPAACRADEISGEVDRLGGMIDALAARGGEDNAIRLQAEMEDIRKALADVARETTAEKRWNDLDRRLDAFAGPDSELVKTVQSRLEQLGSVVATLPEPAAMHALDDKLKVLAAAMDRFAQKQGPLGDGALSLIDERLDEISRAIAASAGTGRGLIVDGKPFERIEARIGSLAKQIDELIEDRPTVDIGAQIAAMSERIDEIAARSAIPHETMTRLTEQMSVIAGKVDAIPFSPDLSEIFKGVEARFAAFSQTVDERSAAGAAKSEQLFAELDARLGALTEKLETVQAGQSRDALMAAMDERLAVFADSFEKRLGGISQRLETTTATLVSIDPDLVKSLEAQVASLAEAIQSPARMPAEFEDVAPRLERLERIIADNHAAMLESAREAAEQAARAIGPAGSGDNNVVQGLADDLRTLEALARRSDERNTKTFEAIHDTLLKIVERLGAMEHDAQDEHDAPRVGIMETPSLHADVDDMSMDTALDAEMPLASERAAEPPQDADQPRSMIARVLGRKRRERDAASASAAPELELDAPIDPAIVNQPIEPGHGSPDLNAIMRRVRDERTVQGKDSTTTDVDAKADFIAAARRAAQAAAAEAETLKSGKSADGSQRFSLSKLLKSRNRAVSMGIIAVTLALAGIQIGKTLTADEAVASAEPSDQVTLGAVDIQNAETIPAPAQSQNVRDLTAMAKEPAATPVAKPVLAAVKAPAADQARIETASIAPDIRNPAPIQPTLPNDIVNDDDAGEAPSVTAVPLEAGNTVLREAAAAGDPKAWFEIGNRYAEGRGVEADMKAAALWYESAADAGLAPAQYRLANMFEKATGVERDIPRAIALYEKAAAKGNASAMHNLAVLQAMGANGRTDNSAAARNFTKAAELGVRDSQFNLAILAAKGVGMKQDLAAAYKWLAIVAAAGDADAAAKRDEVAKLLAPADLEKAKKTVELWKPKTLDAEANAVTIPEAWTEDMEATASTDLGAAIKRVQAILNAHGYDAGNPDGIIGARTTSAIAAFQKDNQMEPTGRIDEPLVRALLALG